MISIRQAVNRSDPFKYTYSLVVTETEGTSEIQILQEEPFKYDYMRMHRCMDMFEETKSFN